MVVEIFMGVYRIRKGAPSKQCLALVPVRQPTKRQVPWRCVAFALLEVRARKLGGLYD